MRTLRIFADREQLAQLERWRPVLAAWNIPDTLPGVETGMAAMGQRDPGYPISGQFPISFQGTFRKSGQGGTELRPRVSAPGSLSRGRGRSRSAGVSRLGGGASVATDYV